MADKLSWSELRRALASRANVSEKEANTFLNALNAELVEALKQDKQVRVNGLGTFKLQAVAPRKSVDVTTGEEITIESQIILIIDSFYALLERRPYRDARTKEEAIKIIMSEINNKWSEKLASEFIAIVREDLF